jgi:hypothetical protein
VYPSLYTLVSGRIPCLYSLAQGIPRHPSSPPVEPRKQRYAKRRAEIMAAPNAPPANNGPQGQQQDPDQNENARREESRRVMLALIKMRCNHTPGLAQCLVDMIGNRVIRPSEEEEEEDPVAQ